MNPIQAGALKILQDARGLIATPGQWTQGAMARDVNGGGRYWHSPDAVCFCSRAAIALATLCSRLPCIRDLVMAEDAAIEALVEAIGGERIEDWNDADGRTHAEVLGAFDKAIATLGA